MSDGRFSVVFDGLAVKNGEIDVADFAPAVLALGELIKEANQTLNGDRAIATVKLKASKQGSFEAMLMLDFSWVEAAKDFFSDGESVASANGLLELLIKGGAIGSVTSYSLFKVIQTLKGRKPEKAKEEGGAVTIEQNGVQFVTDRRVITLYESIAIREKIEDVTKALERPGIDSVSFENGDTWERLTLEKSERQYFKVPGPDEGEEEVTEFEQEMRLQARDITFKDGNKWRFTAGDETFLAAIEDVTFLNKVANDEVSFAKAQFTNRMHGSAIAVARQARGEAFSS